MYLKKILKKIHHRILTFHILKKKYSLFGNETYKICGTKKDTKTFTTTKSAITVVVLNHNNEKIITKCVDSLQRHNTYGYKIVVVDNASTDESLKLLENKYGNSIILLKNKINGCSSGRNMGAKMTQTELIMFIDSDQGPTSHHWLDDFLYIMKTNPNVGAIGNMGGFFTEEDVSGPTLDLYQEKGLPKEYLFRTNIDYLCTGGMMVRREVFDSLKGFDTNYDPYCFEDADLSRNIVKMGKQIAYCTSLPIYHEAHTTTNASENNRAYLKQFSKNAAYFRKKWLT